MLVSYEAIYDHGKIKWLSDAPTFEEAKVIVTVLATTEAPKPVRKPSEKIAGKGKILGDITAPAAPEGDWQCLN